MSEQPPGAPSPPQVSPDGLRILRRAPGESAGPSLPDGAYRIES